MPKSRIADAYVTASITMDGLGDDIAKKLKTGFEDATEKVKQPVEKESEKVGGSWATKFAAGIAASGAIAAVGAKISDSISKGLEQSSVNSKVAGALALNAEDTKKISEVSKKLFTSAYGDSYEEAADAMKNIVSTVKGARTASAVELEKMGKDALNVSSTFGKGTDEIANAANVMINSGLVKNWDEAISTITAGFQTAGGAGDDYLDTFMEFSDDFKRFGLDGRTAVNLVASAVNAGMKDTDKFADALNEMSITIRDGSIDENIVAINIDPKQLRKDIAAGGETARAALIEVLTKLQKNGDVTNFQAFLGSLGEDFTSVFQNMDLSTVNAQFREGVGNMQALDAAASTPEGKIKAMKASFEQLFIDLLMPILEQVLPMLQDFTKFLQENEWAVKILAVTIGIVMVLAIIGMTVALWGMAAAGWAALIPIIGLTWPILLAIAAVVGLIAAWTWMADKFGGSTKMMTAAWNEFVDGIKQLWEDIKNIFGAIGDFFGGVFSAEAQMKVVSGDMPMMANGGTIAARPGGTPVILGEAGRDEVVMDSGKWNALIDQMMAEGVGGTGDHIEFHISTRDTESAEETVTKIADYMEFNRTR